MSVAADVSDWIPTPAPLNDEKSGVNAIFSTDNSIVQRRNPEIYRRDCVSYTRGPLPPGQVWQVTVLETTRKWSSYYGLVSGCVLNLLYHHMIWCVSTSVIIIRTISAMASTRVLRTPGDMRR